MGEHGRPSGSRAVPLARGSAIPGRSVPVRGRSCKEVACRAVVLRVDTGVAPETDVVGSRGREDGGEPAGGVGMRLEGI